MPRERRGETFYVSIKSLAKPYHLSLFVIAAAPLVLANCSSSASSDNGGSSGAGKAGAATSVGGANTSGGAPSAGAASAGAASAGAPSAGAAAGGTSSGGAATGGSGGLAAAGSGGGGAGGVGGAAGTTSSGGASGGSTGGAFKLTSPDQAEGAHFSMMFTCAANNGTFGSGVNPELDWTGAPAGTMSFAITFIDTKIGANMAMGQHWASWDIPAAVMQFPKGTTLLTGALAGAKQTNKYLAPCPNGDDTYAYTLYALSTSTLTVTGTGVEGSGTANSAGVAAVLNALKGVTPLGTATLHGTSSAMGK
jgi:phosphatidylethanolamine-binding protein (PEBP) family uncharacterized protein